MTYGSYLRVEKLLDQQVLESDPPAHDELLFITIHQVYELWFKQLLHELSAVRDAMLAGNLWWARHLLARVNTIERLLVAQIDVLETMTPQDFLEFREQLAPASGFQSVQFRELEFLSGAKDPDFWNASGDSPTWNGTGFNAASTSPACGTPLCPCSCELACPATTTRRCSRACGPSLGTARRTARSGSSPSGCSTMTRMRASGAPGT